MRRVIVVFLLSVLAALAGGETAFAQVNSFACYGAPADYVKNFDASDGKADGAVKYPQPRTYVAAQEWWEADEFGLSGFDAGHIHVEACVPVNQQVVGGTLKFGLKLMLHDINGGGVNSLQVRIDDSTFLLKTTLSPYMNTEGTRFVSISANTALFGNDGLHQIRILATGSSGQSPADPDDEALKHRAVIRADVNLQNGKPESDGVTSLRDLDSCGWYTGVEYACVQMLTNVSSTPIGSAKTFSVKWRRQGTSLNMVRRFASVDPDFHNGDPGIVLVNQAMNAGSFTGTVRVDPIALGLTPGVHRLFLRSDVKNSAGDNINAGALVIPFTVGGQ